MHEAEIYAVSIRVIETRALEFHRCRQWRRCQPSGVAARLWWLERGRQLWRVGEVALAMSVVGGLVRRVVALLITTLSGGSDNGGGCRCSGNSDSTLLDRCYRSGIQVGTNYEYPNSCWCCWCCALQVALDQTFSNCFAKFGLAAISRNFRRNLGVRATKLGPRSLSKTF